MLATTPGMTIPLAVLGMRTYSSSDPFVVERRDEHASVLSLALFLVVIDLLLRDMSRVCT